MSESPFAARRECPKWGQHIFQIAARRSEYTVFRCSCGAQVIR